jgi:hypothetical protein
MPSPTGHLPQEFVDFGFEMLYGLNKLSMESA